MRDSKNFGESLQEGSMEQNDFDLSESNFSMSKKGSGMHNFDVSRSGQLKNIHQINQQR